MKRFGTILTHYIPLYFYWYLKYITTKISIQKHFNYSSSLYIIDHMAIENNAISLHCVVLSQQFLQTQTWVGGITGVSFPQKHLTHPSNGISYEAWDEIHQPHLLFHSLCLLVNYANDANPKNADERDTREWAGKERKTVSVARVCRAAL